MLFNLERDTKTSIVGYLVPDGFADHPRIAVCDPSGKLFEMDCNEMREAIIQSGRHETGINGFRVDDKVLPDIAAYQELSVFDAKSGVLIYRRVPKDSVVAQKIVRVETQIIPFLALDHAIKPRFQYGAEGADRFGVETVMQMFHLHAIPSIYIAGRLHIKGFTEFLDRDFKAVTVINEP